MTTNWRSWVWKLADISWLAMGGAIASFGNCALAQNITLDGTLGSPGTLTGPNYIIPQEVGRTVDSNLFHSFGRFGLAPGEAAIFESAANIRNILSRVTGGSASLIDGLISTQSANVNLFLINPSGIVFGPNARLDVGGVARGSFVATTVDALVWPNGGQFSATNPGGPSNLLTLVGDPSGFLSSLRTPQSIESSASNLEVYEGQSLLLLGGDVSFDGSFFAAPGGRVELGGVAGAGTVGLNVDSNNLGLSFPDGVTRADVLLTNGAFIDVTAGGSGSIAINAQNLDVLEGSSLFAGIREGLGTVGSQAGDITLNATGAITIADSSVFNELESGSVGKGGDINIQAGSIFVTDGAELGTRTLGQGDGGSVFMQANESVSLSLYSAISSAVEFGAVGKGGDINIQAGSFSLTDNSFLITSTRGRGDGGSVLIQANNFVSVANGDIFSDVEDRAVGKGGDINIQAGSISLTDGTELSASTFGQGGAGDVFMQANQFVSITDSLILNTVESMEAIPFIDFPGSRAVGNGGDITINAESLSLNDRLDIGGGGAVVSTTTRAQGNAGNVVVRVDDFVSVSYGVISTAVEAEGVGQGGNIDIQARSLSLTKGSFLNARTVGQGKGGNIQVNASDFVNLSGFDPDGWSSEFATSTETGAIGQAGDITVNSDALRLSDGAVLNTQTRNSSNGGKITINANTLEVANGGQVVTTSRDRGKAGNITLNIADSATLAGSDPTYFERVAQLGEDLLSNISPASGLFANTFENSTGQGGDLTITTGQLVVRDGAQVNVSSEGTGNAGNLEVASRDLRLDNRAVLSSSTSSGEGGNIKLRDQELILMRRNSEISTSARGTGNGGNIDIINTDFIVALPGENSDIVADAFQGNGGNINITTQGIFGLNFREQRLPESSDITASSDFGLDGTVDINTPDIDPNSGLINLPVEPVDTEVAQGCTTGGSVAKSEFIITGRGGLPLNPGDALSTDAVQVDLITLNPEAARPSTTAVSISPTSSKPARIVEAQGWTIGANGKVILTANAPTLTPHSSWYTPANCHVPKTLSVPLPAL